MSRENEFHKVAYTYHDAQASAHAVMMGHYAEGTPEHAFHKSGHASDTTKRDFHGKCMKADHAGDLERIIADERAAAVPVVPAISGVTPNPDAVTTTRPGIVPVFRTGQAPFPTAAPQLNASFAKMLSAPFDEEDAWDGQINQPRAKE